MIDALVANVLEEIAMDGPEGTPVNRLETFVHDFFYPAAPLLSQVPPPRNVRGALRPTIDSSFTSFVWDTLLQQPGVSVIVLEEIEGARAAFRALSKKSGAAKDDKDSQDEESNKTPARSRSKGKGKGKMDQESNPPTHNVRVLKGDERAEGRDALLEAFGDNLRITVSAEMCWVAITGSHARPSSMTESVYRLLQFVSRTRGDGATVVEIGTHLGVEQGSAFHLVNAAVKHGAVMKFRAQTPGSWTNRIIHIRYLDVSAPWALFNAHEDTVSRAARESESDNSGDDQAPPRMAKLEVEELYTNNVKVRGRIIKVVEAAPNMAIYHSYIARAIGLRHPVRDTLRKLNTHIMLLCHDGLLEKINFKHKAARSPQSHDIFVNRPGLRRMIEGGIAGPTEVEIEGDEVPLGADDVDDERRFASATLPLDRQIMDLLAEAGTGGLRNSDISIALGGYSIRTIDQMLNKLEREIGPAHLRDYSIHTVSETVGRQKNNRFFLLPHYLQRAINDGCPDETMGVKFQQYVDRIGGWSDLESVRFYKDPASYEVYLSKLSFNTGAKALVPRTQKAASKKKALSSKDEADVSEDGDESFGTPAKKGRATKEKPPSKSGGKLSYYERTKLAAAERERQGLPPKEKRAPTGGGRRSKATIAAIELAEAEEAAAILRGDEPRVVPVKKKYVRKPRKEAQPVPVDDSAEQVNSEVEIEAADGEASDTLPIKAKQVRKSRAKPKAIPIVPAEGSSVDDAAGVLERETSPVASTSTFIPTLTTTKTTTKRPASLTPLVAAKKRIVEVELAETDEEEGPADPAASATHDPTPEATSPIVKSKPSTPVPAAKRPKSRPTKMPPKSNLTNIKLQNQMLAYITSQGGIVEKNPKLADGVKAQALIDAPGSATFTMDRYFMQNIIQGLMDRGVIKMLTTQVGAGVEHRRDILYLSSTEPDSPSMNSFLNGLKDVAAKTSRTVYSTVEVENEDDGEKKVVKKGKDKAEVVEPIKVEPISAEASLEDVRASFVRQPKVLAAKYGLMPGRFAKARALHQFLVKYAEVESEETEEYIVSRDPLVFTKDLLFSVIPLGLFLSLVSIAIDSPQLDEFLTRPANHNIPVGKLNKSITAIIKPRNSKRHHSMHSNCNTLMALNLLTALQPSPPRPGDDGAETVLEAVASWSNKVTHYQINDRAPIYAFAEGEVCRLVAVPATDTEVTSVNFWNRLFNASLVDHRPTQPALVSTEFPSQYKGSYVIATQIASAVKWTSTYTLLRPQKDYLQSLLARPEEPLDLQILTQPELQQIADAILAPVDVVESELPKLKVKLDTRARIASGGGISGEKRRRISRRSGSEGDDDEDDEDDELLDEADRPISKRIGKQATGASKMLRELWDSLLSRFNIDHNDPHLDLTILNFLHAAFTKRRKIDATQLDFELRLLAGIDPDPSHSSRVTIVTKSIRQGGAGLGAARSRLGKNDTGKRIGKIAGSAPAVIVPIVPTGDQDEFLTEPAKPIPVLPANGRLSRTQFTAEQDELTLDATAILRVRAEYLGTGIKWAPLTILFRGMEASKLGTRSQRLTKKPEESTYFENLQISWRAVWDQRKDTSELPDPNPESMTEFDIAAYVRCLRKYVDKQELRLAGPPLEALPASRNLPATITDMFANFTITPTTAATNYISRWKSYLKAGFMGSSLTRELENASLPFTISNAKDVSVEGEFDHRTRMAIAAMKMVIASPVHTFSTDQALSITQQFDDSTVEAAVEYLLRYNIIARYHTEPGRRVPGRNYVIEEKFLIDLEGDDLSQQRLRDAEYSVKNIYERDPQETWPLIVRDGDMITFIQLISDGMLKLKIDAEPYEDKRGLNDYETRKMVDEDIELGVYVEPVDGHPTLSQKPVDLSNAVVFSTDEDALTETLDQICSTLDDDVKDIAASLAAGLIQAGEAGLELSDIIDMDVSRNVYLRVIDQFVTSSPPLAFWAGHFRAVLVSVHHLSSWSILTRSPVIPSIPSDSDSMGPPIQFVKTVERKGKKGPKRNKSIVSVVVLNGSEDEEKSDRDGDVVVDADESDEDDEDAIVLKKSKGKEVDRQKSVSAPVIAYQTPRLTFPAIWLDIEGGMIEVVWKKAVICVQSILMLCSGSTLYQIHERAQVHQLLTLTEIMTILLSLEKSGSVKMRSSHVEARFEDVADLVLDWEHCHWFLNSGLWFSGLLEAEARDELE